MVFSLVISLYLVVRSDLVQSVGVRLGADYLSEELKTVVRIRGFSLSLLHGLIIEDISILDREKEVLFSARELGVIPGKVNLSDRKIHFHHVYIDNGVVQLLTHKGDSAINFQFIVNYFASGDTTPPTDTTTSAPWKLSLSAVTLRNTRFHFQDKNEPPAEAGMDYSNIDVSKIDLELTDIDLSGDTIRTNIKHLSATDRSGFRVHNLSGEFQVGSRILEAKNLKIVTDNSDLALSFQFLYKNWNAYNEFLTDVNIIAKIEPCYLDLQDIGYFAPELLVMKDRVRISGDIHGTVSNFKAKDLRFAFGKNSFFFGNVNAYGLPDVENTYINLNIKALSTNESDVESIKIPGSVIELPDVVGALGTVGVRGTFSGYYNDFIAKTQIATDLGSVKTDVTLRKQKHGAPTRYQGNLDVMNVDLGRIVGSSPMLGAITARGTINGSGFGVDDANVTLNIVVDSIGFNSYIYRNLDVEGALSDKKFDGKLKITDPNIRLVFDGLVDFSDTIPVFNFSSQIFHAMLFQLNLLKRDSLENFSARIRADIRGKNPDNLDGSLRIENAVYAEGNKSITLDKLYLITRQDTASGKSYHLQSDILDADIRGNFSFSALVPSVVDFIDDYLNSFTLNNNRPVTSRIKTDQELQFRINIKKAKEVTNIFIPVLDVAPKTEISGYYDEKNGKIGVKGSSPSIIVAGLELDDWYLSALSSTDILSIETGSRAFYLKKASREDSLEIRMDTLKLFSTIQYDTIKYHLLWKDHARSSDIGGFVSFLNSPVMNIKFDRFNVFLADKYWSVSPENYLSVDSSSVEITKLDFSSGDQYLRLNGTISEAKKDTVNVFFNKVDISLLDRLLGMTGIDINGVLSGNFKATSLYSDVTLLADLRLDNFVFNSEHLGDATFKVTYNSARSRFDLLSQIVYKGNAGTNIPFSMAGSLFLDSPNPEVDFRVDLKNLNLRMFNPFVNSFMSGLTGLASGDIKVKGQLNRPNITGQLKLMRTEFKINYLNVPYSFADVIRIDTNAFHFDNIVLYDSLGHKAQLNGKITHRYFSDIRLDLHVKMDDFAAFNNNRSQNPTFYGQARGSGSVDITGPVDKINISVKAQNGGNTHVVIPIDLTQDVGQVDYIVFLKNVEDTTVVNTVEKPRKDPSGISLDLGLRVSQDATVEVYLPSQLGKLTGSGTGNLLLTMSPVSPFALSGTYTISKGSFLFQFKNYLRLPMQIREGSTITWTGDPADANITISAIYRLKSTLKGLTADPNEEGLRIPVECVIRLGGKLLNPTLSFGINLPNVEEGIKTLVYSSIDTNNPVVMNEQTLSLLILNQFKPVVSSSSGTTVDVGAASMSLITNQINSWISGLSQNVNVNMNYRPGSATAQQEFDVGFSTQFLDDRLLIDGTFGMNTYNSTAYQQTSTIVGDINIEYVLTKNRRWRVRAFNRTNTLNILNNNAPYTQGVGFKYQRDFANFHDLFDRSKKKLQKQ